MNTPANMLGYPQEIVDLVVMMRNQYDDGNTHKRGNYITVTQLVDPPQLIDLKWKYKQEIKQDMGDMMAVTLGSMKHQILENLKLHPKYAGCMFEKRWSVEFEGWTISGQVDFFDPVTARLNDYKYTSVYSFYRELKPEYKRQVNILAWLLRKHTWHPVHLGIIGIARDWSLMKARLDKNYAGKWARYQKVPRFSDEQIENWLRKRLKEQEAAEKRFCTDEERYMDGKPWAAVKHGNKNATKLFDRLEEAEAWIAAQSDSANFAIEGREVDMVRCRYYCSVREFCKQANADGQADKR